MNKLRIGLDIDDVLADFWGAYHEYFDTENNPEMLVDSTVTHNVETILINDRNFWINLPVLRVPDFEPTLYCTKRVNKKCWTKTWVNKNNLPNKAVYQTPNYNANKAHLIKGRVDVFIDDSLHNFIEMNLSGVPCLLMDHPNNREWGPIGRVFSLDKDEIEETYNLLMDTVFNNFNNLLS